jgi:hypothetical protein
MSGAGCCRIAAPQYWQDFEPAISLRLHFGQAICSSRCLPQYMQRIAAGVSLPHDLQVTGAISKGV